MNAPPSRAKIVQHALTALMNTPVNVFQGILVQIVKKTHVTQILAKMAGHALKAVNVNVNLDSMVTIVKKTSTNASPRPVKMVQHALKALVYSPANVFQDLKALSANSTSTNVTPTLAKMVQLVMRVTLVSIAAHALMVIMVMIVKLILMNALSSHVILVQTVKSRVRMF
jgi:hypothetical protein